jgi:hypothetical protein
MSVSAEQVIKPMSRRFDRADKNAISAFLEAADFLRDTLVKVGSPAPFSDETLAALHSLSAGDTQKKSGVRGSEA